MGPVFKLVVKDLKQFFSDRTAVILSFIVPAIMAVIFGVTFGGMAGESVENKKLEFDYVDLDKSEISAKILDSLKADDTLKPYEVDEKKAYADVKGGKRAAGLIIPIGFGEKVKSGEKVDLKIIYDPSNYYESGMLQGLLQQAIFTADISKYVMPNMVEKMMRKKGESEGAIAIAKLYINKYMVQPDEEKSESDGSKNSSLSSNELFKDYPINIKAEKIVGNDVGTTAAYVQSVISAMLIFLMFSVTHGAGALIREQKRGTLKRLLLSPLSVGGILTGKLISIMITGIIEIYFMLIVGWIIFGLQIWDFPVQLFLMAFATAMMTSGLGVMLTGFAKTEEQVSMLATLVIITLNAIGGAMIPRFFMPDFMKNIGYVSPVSWAIDGFHNVFWRHTGFEGMIVEFVVLIGFALVFLFVGTMMVRAKLKSL